MDPDRFDTVTRSLTRAGSRRVALATALSGALGLLGLTQPEDALAAKSGKCKPKCGECEKCRKGDCERKNGRKVCKKGKCQAKGNGTTCAVASGAGGTCQSGTCVITCTGGTTNCGGVCRDLQTDEANCGACGTGCGATQVCQTGSCFPMSDCPASKTSVCSQSSLVVCGSNCLCGRSAEGNVLCLLNAPICPAPATTCQTSADCPVGEACVDVGECCNLDRLPAGTKTCMARCPQPRS